MLRIGRISIGAALDEETLQKIAEHIFASAEENASDTASSPKDLEERLYSKGDIIDSSLRGAVEKISYEVLDFFWDEAFTEEERVQLVLLAIQKTCSLRNVHMKPETKNFPETLSILKYRGTSIKTKTFKIPKIIKEEVEKLADQIVLAFQAEMKRLSETGDRWLIMSVSYVEGIADGMYEYVANYYGVDPYDDRVRRKVYELLKGIEKEAKLT